MLANIEPGIEAADVTDKVNHAQRPRLHRVGMPLDDRGQVVAPGVLERADRQQLVVLARNLAEITFDNRDAVLQPSGRHLGAQLRDLFGRGVDAGAARPVMLQRMEQQPAPAAADVDKALTGLEPDLAADVIHLVELRLFERARPFLPVGAGVHHADAVEPRLVERLAEAVVKARVGLGLSDRRVRIAELVPAVAQRDHAVRVVAVETGVEGGARGEG